MVNELVRTVIVRVVGQQLGDGLGRRPRVEEDRPVLGKLLEGTSGDGPLLGREPGGAGGERGLELEPLDGDRAAVDAAQGAAPLEHGEVPADGLGGDPQLLGECADLDPAHAPCLVGDALLSLGGVHRTPSSNPGAPPRHVAVGPW